MPRNQLARRTDDVRAASVLVQNTDSIMGIVASSLADVDPGQTALAGCVRDARIVFDIAKRLDDLIPVPERVESWDILLWALVAGLALGIYRAAQRKQDPDSAAAALARKALSTAKDRAASAG